MAVVGGRVRSGAVLLAALAVAVLVGVDGSPAWQVVRVLVSVAVVLGIASLNRPVLDALLGAVVVAVGIGFVPHLVDAPGTVRAAASTAALLAGAVLLAGGTARAVRGTSWPRRTAGALLALLGAALVAWTIGPAVAVTNVPAGEIGATPASLGLAHEDVTLTTADGVRLAAWYLPSRDGAAVVLRHGAGSTRSNVLRHAAVLARSGYGVLLVDARGHGESQGRAMDFGWHGDLDIAAAVDHLGRRADVDAGRIGLVGMSMGGEEAIGAAAAVRVRAVVAEGATARVAADKAWLSEVYGLRGAIQEQLERAQYGLTDLLTDAAPPTVLRDAVLAAEGTSFLLIAADGMPDEGHAAEHLAGAAPARVDVWAAPGGHTDALADEPVEWERRVVAFLDAEL